PRGCHRAPPPWRAEPARGASETSAQSSESVCSCPRFSSWAPGPGPGAGRRDWAAHSARGPGDRDRSPLLAGDTAPPEPLVETLAALARAPETSSAQVIMAISGNRCADEAKAFCAAAEARGIWKVSLAEPDDFLEGYNAKSAFYGSDEGPHPNVVHLTVAAPATGEEAGTDCKRRRVDGGCPGEPVSVSA
ncbi:unnamed protein product, partial [Prorocentrum cordatum]